MIIVMKENATDEQKERVKKRLTELGFDIHQSTGVLKTIFGAVGQVTGWLVEEMQALEGIDQAFRVSDPFKLAGRSFHPDPTVIRVGKAEVGGNRVVVMAGPCSVEDREGMRRIARSAAAGGATVLRGGAFKPRSSPYAFQGLGKEGLEILAAVAAESGLATVSEVMDTRDVDLVCRYVDVLQIGARNMQNTPLLKEVGRTAKPVLLKRGLSATIEEWIMAAEYVMSEGNYQVMMCERGIRTYETSTRNTLDISAIPIVHEKTHLPVVADPSHAVGRRDKVIVMARAAVAAGADALLVEIHHNPEVAVSDGPQTLFLEQFAQMMAEIRPVARAIGRDA
ncbi:MAG: 3-deoxy-7-phosphoheptulonate synthase [Planctomycetes bacterium]|nr:3-deoxy-7-phosphoheptulonate synthase [Planctomycetota bacterium]